LDCFRHRWCVVRPHKFCKVFLISAQIIAAASL
jgi:hypothetical protein